MIRISKLTISCKLLFLLSLTFIVLSCSPNNNPGQSLVSYCIRECVIETSASEICDTECKCATKKLSSDYSKEDFANLVQAIEQEKADSIAKLTNALQSCKDARE